MSRGLHVWGKFWLGDYLICKFFVFFKFDNLLLFSFHYISCMVHVRLSIPDHMPYTCELYFWYRVYSEVYRTISPTNMSGYCHMEVKTIVYMENLEKRRGLNLDSYLLNMSWRIWQQKAASWILLEIEVKLVHWKSTVSFLLNIFNKNLVQQNNLYA